MFIPSMGTFIRLYSSLRAAMPLGFVKQLWLQATA